MLCMVINDFATPPSVIPIGQAPETPGAICYPPRTTTSKRHSATMSVQSERDRKDRNRAPPSFLRALPDSSAAPCHRSAGPTGRRRSTRRSRRGGGPTPKPTGRHVLPSLREHARRSCAARAEIFLPCCESYRHMGHRTISLHLMQKYFLVPLTCCHRLWHSAHY